MNVSQNLLNIDIKQNLFVTYTVYQFSTYID